MCTERVRRTRLAVKDEEVGDGGLPTAERVEDVLGQHATEHGARGRKIMTHHAREGPVLLSAMLELGGTTNALESFKVDERYVDGLLLQQRAYGLLQI